jgi:hypothetical protein
MELAYNIFVMKLVEMVYILPIASSRTMLVLSKE